MVSLQSVWVWLISLSHYTGLWMLPTRSASSDESERFRCRPFLPKLFIDTPPQADHHIIKDASKRLGDYFSTRFSKGGIDSLSVAVITSEGPVFVENYGVIRGNESNSLPTNIHSMYRLASASKLFAVLEGHVLQQKGVLAWDDSVDKYLPQFKYRPDGFDPAQKPMPTDEAPITLFQLASHMSGLGRDWPPGTVKNWPKDIQGGGPPPTNGLPFPSHSSFFEAIANHRLTSPPFAYPAYSNTGMGLLGLSVVAANRAVYGSKQPELYADLVQRDIFDPMGLNGSHFLPTESNKHLVVVPSIAPEVADQDFLDAMNSAGGQFSSLSDLITLVQTLLNPRRPKSLITQHTMNTWLHSTHAFEEDDWTEIGFMWEIIKAKDSNGRLRKIYWKLGDVGGYHTAIAIHPGTSYGIVILMGGQYSDASKLAYDAFEIFQPAVDSALSGLATSLYTGKWASTDGESTALIVVDKGTLYLEKFVLNRTDVHAMFRSSGRLALRSSERRDELRIDTGYPGYNGEKHMGCYPYWNGQDLWGLRNEAPINLIYFTGATNERALHVPSANIVLRRD